MRRRAFISLLGGAAVWPLTARAEQTMPVVGFLNAAIADHYKKFTNEFSRGLREMGLSRGRMF
jgi:putative ABC transport system substrate-binding protein